MLTHPNNSMSCFISDHYILACYLSEIYLIDHLLPEDIGQDSPDDEDNSEKEKDDEVCEDEALDLLPGGKAAKDREKREDDGDDEHDVGGVQVEPAPQQLVQEGLVFDCPDGEGKKNKTGDKAKASSEI